MTDRYLIYPKCEWCGEDLSDEQPLFMSDEDSPLVFICHKCGKKTKYWVMAKIKSKKVES